VDEPKEEEKHQEEKPIEREVVFQGPFNRVDDLNFEDEIQNDSFTDEDEDGLFNSHDEEFDRTSEKYGDQRINDEGMMELQSTRKRLEEQARQRKDKLKNARRQEMTKEEFNEKWSLPAYLRKGIKMDSVQHSSEPFISKYNLNDDNSILGNNKFLHDNVD
jgi:cell division protein FtsZ